MRRRRLHDATSSTLVPSFNPATFTCVLHTPGKVSNALGEAVHSHLLQKSYIWNAAIEMIYFLIGYGGDIRNFVRRRSGWPSTRRRTGGLDGSYEWWRGGPNLYLITSEDMKKSLLISLKSGRDENNRQNINRLRFYVSQLFWLIYNYVPNSGSTMTQTYDFHGNLDFGQISNFATVRNIVKMRLPWKCQLWSLPKQSVKCL